MPNRILFSDQSVIPWYNPAIVAMTGAEIAWRTLRRVQVDDPCIIGSWIMKREFFRRFTGVADIYREPVQTAVDAYANAGCNLNPQFIMPAARARNSAIARAVADYDIAPVVYSGDDICFNDGPICSVELLDEIYFPALSFAIEPLVDANIDIVWHCDGNVLPIVQRLIDAGITGFQGFQEREAKIPFEEMAQFRRGDGDNLIFFGSVSVVDVLPFGSLDDIDLEIERCFKTAGREGGFCLAPTSSILPETPIENIERFFEYGREFGSRFFRGAG